MPPKKKSNNAGKSPFYHLLQEVQRKRGVSMHEATQIAGDMWQRMDASARKPYETMALAFKNNVQLRKYTSDGVDLEHIDQIQKEKENWHHQMVEYMDKDIKTAYQIDGNIETKVFFIIHFNIFCHHESEDTYYPSEVGLVAFNLRDGVLPENVYHSIIEPGDLPIGFYGTAALESRNTHKIKPPTGINNPSNMEKIFFDILDFIELHQKTLKQPIVLYTKEKYIPIVKKILDQWTAAFDDKFVFEAYNLQLMFNTLKATISGKLPEMYGFYEISKDVYSHVSNIACEYHIDLESQEFCSRSKVIRAAYTICDNCIQDLGIELIPGQHVPDNVGNFSSTSRPSSRGTEGSYASSTCGSRTEWDAESTTSTVEYPNLDERYRPKESDWTTVGRNSAPKAGISNKKMATNPSIVQKMRYLSVGSNNFNAEAGGNSDSSLSSEQRSQNERSHSQINLNERDFPSLGSRGRGRNLRRN